VKLQHHQYQWFRLCSGRARKHKVLRSAQFCQSEKHEEQIKMHNLVLIIVAPSFSWSLSFGHPKKWGIIFPRTSKAQTIVDAEIVQLHLRFQFFMDY